MMMLRCAAAVVFLAAPLPAAHGQEVHQLALRELKVGDQLEVTTSGRIYRATLVDPATGEMSATVSRDGTDFSSPARVYFIGGTAGRQDRLLLVSMGQLQVGLRIEMGLGSRQAKDRTLSEPVTSIRVRRERQSS